MNQRISLMQMRPGMVIRMDPAVPPGQAIMMQGKVDMANIYRSVWIDEPMAARVAEGAVGFLAMFETADGCIRFQLMTNSPETLEFAITGPVKMLEQTDIAAAASVTHQRRTYDLIDRGHNVLHYKERVG